jgi:NAD(P)-dependent dehydrogenase (short-subunit alcohol dehydrogenase family)
MSPHQHPLDTGLGPRTTTAETLQGIELSGRVALVTGGYSGIGLETTRALAAAGASVIVPSRRPEVARTALQGTPRVSIEEVDLGDMESIRRFSERQLATKVALNMVIANAGVMALAETRVGPGWEGHFAINHLGHYALVNLLWPAIAEGSARVVAVSSAVHRFSDIHWDDVQFSEGYNKQVAYAQSKTANILFAVALDARGREQGVRALATRPGSVLTPLQRHMTREEMLALGWIDESGRGIDPGFKTADQGAATQTWAATSPLLADPGGIYCGDCDVAPIDDENTSDLTGVRPYAIDTQAADRLWELSGLMTGLHAL